MLRKKVTHPLGVVLELWAKIYQHNSPPIPDTRTLLPSQAVSSHSIPFLWTWRPSRHKSRQGPSRPGGRGSPPSWYCQGTPGLPKGAILFSCNEGKQEWVLVGDWGIPSLTEGLCSDWSRWRLAHSLPGWVWWPEQAGMTPCQDSLPELNHRWPLVGEFIASKVAVCSAIGAVTVPEDLYTLGGIPGVPARCPRQGGCKRLHQVVETPCKHHDVVGVAIEDDHHGGKPQPCGEKSKIREQVSQEHLRCSFPKLLRCANIACSLRSH